MAINPLEMKFGRFFSLVAALLLSLQGRAAAETMAATETTATTKSSSEAVLSPDGKTKVEVMMADGGRLCYSVFLNGERMLESSNLGVYTNIGNFTEGLTLKAVARSEISDGYEMHNAKLSHKDYKANRMELTLENADGREMGVLFEVSNNNAAFRYSFPQYGETAVMVIDGEETSFRFPENTTTFICPQADPMSGWKRTKPSYEEEYKADAPMNEVSKYGHGYTFPCLFHVGERGWVLVSETGVDGSYVGSHLSDYDKDRGYTIAFPMPGEANGLGSTGAGLALPGKTPWRTITLGETLAPIVETTISYDVVKPRYNASEEYKGGRYTWSWLIWQDESINYEDQLKYIDLASAMGYEYVLVDNWWDKNIGRSRMETLSRYAQSKGVSLMLWYNSNGYENDAPQTPKQCMNTAVERKKELSWLKSIGVKGIKVDFFAGDKQHTMQLYEDILSDANDYGIQVIFHGCTLPRGWERMFPNFVASEAVLASENVYFTEYHAKEEAFQLCLHPFCRNAVASMDYGGVIMNRYLSKDNKSRHPRYTTDVFEAASGIINQSSIQCIALQPNNLGELPSFELEFLKEIPSSWDEVRFIDGYPGKYVVIARRSGENWYVAGLNAEKTPLTLTLSLPMLKGKSLTYYKDEPSKGGEMPEAAVEKAKIDKNGNIKVTIQPRGGIILK